MHVVILGLVNREHKPETVRLFTYQNEMGKPTETRLKQLTAYLFTSSVCNPHLVVSGSVNALNGLPVLVNGSQPIDDRGRNYTFNEAQRAEFLSQEPQAERLLRPYLGSEEHIQGKKRWILCFKDASPSLLRHLPGVQERIRRVREYRSASRRKQTLAIADFPMRYNVEVIPDAPFLVLPKTSSGRRRYLPVGWAEPPTIPSDAFVLQDEQSNFGYPDVEVPYTRLAHVGGRLKATTDIPSHLSTTRSQAELSAAHIGE